MKRPPRFAIEAAPNANGIARVSRAEAHHMRDVARLKLGDVVSLIDENGVNYEGTIAKYDRDGAEVLIAHAERAKPKLSLILAPAIIKGPRMDVLVEKAAKLGASELWPIICARTVGKSPGAERLARWRRIATAASKQSLALPPMQIEEPRSFNAASMALPPETVAMICAAGGEPILEFLKDRPLSPLLIATGPEGDFDRDEFDSAAAAGFVPVGLGPTRLRSETAALAALTIALSTRNLARG